MDRTEYLRMCQQVSMFTDTHRQIPSEMCVKYADNVFLPHGYEMTFKKGKTQHRAILKDLKANAIIYADLERIEKNE